MTTYERARVRGTIGPVMTVHLVAKPADESREKSLCGRKPTTDGVPSTWTVVGVNTKWFNECARCDYIHRNRKEKS